MRRLPLFLALYFASGCAALLYEVLWAREIALVLGNTASAVGVFLATFMAGLATGAWLGGRWAARRPADLALRRYATVELVVAATAFVVPAVITHGIPLWSRVYADGASSVVFPVVRAASGALILAVPTIAMGATYPLAVRWVDTQSRRSAALSYAANTCGAASGALLAGFVLLPTLGRTGTTLVGVCLNLVSAAGAWALASRAPGAGADDTRRTRRRTAFPSTSPLPAISRVLAALAISGAASLMCEVAWTRALALVLGPTTYAFSAMLVAVIGGLAVGASIATPLAARVAQPTRALGVTMTAAATCALAACWLLDRLPVQMASVAGRADATFDLVVWWQAALAVATLLPTTVALGMTFPIAVAALGGATSPAVAARVYTVNTMGAIAGSLAASLALIPAVGLEWTIRLAATLAAATGGLLIWTPTGRRRWVVSAAAIPLVAAVVLPGWNHARLTGGAYRLAPSLAAGDIETALGSGELLYYREGNAGTVSVRRLLGVTSLAIDGKVDASDGADMPTQALLAHLPLLLHEAPRSALVVGLGSGVTAGAALRHPITRLDIAELSPEVVAASHAFDGVNGRPLSDPRTRLLVADGRSHLHLTTRRYDVIVSEPSNPWMAGVAPLFTREFLLAARSRLTETGIVCQWAHTYNLALEDVQSVVATFLSVFPDGTLWLVGSSDLLLIGSPRPIPALDAGIARAWERPGIAADLARVGVLDPFTVASLFVAGGDDLRAFTGAAPVQRDARLSLEFSAPRALYGQYLRPNADRLRHLAATARRPTALARAWSTASPAQWRRRGALDLRTEAPDAAVEHFRLAIEGGDGPEALDGFVRAAADAGSLAAAESFLRALSDRRTDASTLRALSRVIAAQGRADEAAQVAQRAAALAPRDRQVLEWFIDTLVTAGNGPALTQLAGLLASTAPADPTTLYARLKAAAVTPDPTAAAGLAQSLVAVRPADPDLWNALGSARMALGDPTGAAGAFERALALAPRHVAVLANLGAAELALGRLTDAERHFSSAVVLAPTFRPAVEGLAQVFDQQGRSGRARAMRAATTP